MASDNPNVPTEVKVLIEVTVVPAAKDYSDFWDPSPTLVAWGIADRILGKKTDGWKVQSVRLPDHSTVYTKPGT